LQTSYRIEIENLKDSLNTIQQREAIIIQNFEILNNEKADLSKQLLNGNNINLEYS